MKHINLLINKSNYLSCWYLYIRSLFTNIIILWSLFILVKCSDTMYTASSSVLYTWYLMYGPIVDGIFYYKSKYNGGKYLKEQHTHFQWVESITGSVFGHMVAFLMSLYFWHLYIVSLICFLCKSYILYMLEFLNNCVIFFCSLFEFINCFYPYQYWCIQTVWINSGITSTCDFVMFSNVLYIHRHQIPDYFVPYNNISICILYFVYYSIDLQFQHPIL